MDFEETKTMAECWLRENNNRFKLKSADQSENRLFFDITDAQTSFNIVCPCSKGEPWSVSSEDESLLIQLVEVMEFLDSHKNLTVDVVLARIKKQLTEADKLSSKSSDEEDDQEEDNSGDSDDEFAEDNYYLEDDLDVAEANKDETEKEKEKESLETEALENFFSASGSSNASVQRLIKDLRIVTKAKKQFGFSAAPRGSNLYIWDVKLIDIPKDTKLGKDLQTYAERTGNEAAIQMEAQFPSDYPFSPPFIRVIKPRFNFLTGHITVGGSICMEMLTKSGWRPCNDIEGILVHVRSIILSDQHASLDFSQRDSFYTEMEARAAFRRMVQRYGWE